MFGSNGSNLATGSLPMISFVSATVGALFAAIIFVHDSVDNWTLQIHRRQARKMRRRLGFQRGMQMRLQAHSPQALAYLARTVGGDEGGNGANIATLIDGLVSDGVWAKLDAFYVLAQQNQTDALLNLVGTSYWVNICSGFAWRERSPFTLSGYFRGFPKAILDTGFNPATALAQITLKIQPALAIGHMLSPRRNAD